MRETEEVSSIHIVHQLVKNQLFFIVSKVICKKALALTNRSILIILMYFEAIRKSLYEEVLRFSVYEVCLRRIDTSNLNYIDGYFRSVIFSEDFVSK